jgi:histidyl-tRNA synthetase
MYMLRLLLERVGLSGMVLHINSLGCPACRPAYREELRHYLEAQGEGFCPDCRRRRTTNALRVFDCKVERCQELLGDAPVLLEHLCTACLEHFGAVKGCLQQLTTDYRINPRMVRGLDYYTRTTFEIITDQLGAQNAVGGGGRYDGLMRDLGGPDLPGIGFAIGMERLILLVQQQKQGLARRLTLFVATLGAAARARGFALVQELRRLGVETEMDYGESSLKSQMRRADRLGARHVLILGTDELASGTAQLRDMADKGQISIPLAQATEILYRTLAAGHLPHRHEHGRKPAGDEGS